MMLRLSETVDVAAARVVLCVAIALVAGGCGDGTADSTRSEGISPYRMEVGVRYGWRTLDEATRVLSRSESDLEAAVLGEVYQIGTDRAGLVYVLDRLFQKVVVFRPTGELERAIGLAEGEGPGEFVRARSMVVKDDGGIVILDGANNRITELSPAGELRRVEMLGISNPFELMLLPQDQVLVQVGYRSTGDPAGIVLDSDWNVVDSVFPVEDTDAERAAFGESGAFAVTRAGEVRFTPIIPGVWRTQDREIGRFLFPQAVGQIRHDGARYFPVAIRLMTTLDDDSVIQIYNAFASPDWTTESGEPFIKSHVLHLSASGDVISHYPWPDAAGPTALYSRAGANVVLAGVADPFPQVVEYEFVR